MTLAQVQAFLDSKQGGLKDQTLSQQYSFSYLAFSSYFYNYVLANGKYGRESSPAEIIYYSSTDSDPQQPPANRINPIVLLAKLETEQSLITVASNIQQNILDAAVGYACPDSGGCDSKYKGFFNQVVSSAWQLTKFFTDYQNAAVKPTTLVDGAIHHPKNAATYALQMYTPHATGLRSFYDVYSEYNVN